MGPVNILTVVGCKNVSPLFNLIMLLIVETLQKFTGLIGTVPMPDIVGG